MGKPKLAAGVNRSREVGMFQNYFFLPNTNSDTQICVLADTENQSDTSA